MVLICNRGKNRFKFTVVLFNRLFCLKRYKWSFINTEDALNMKQKDQFVPYLTKISVLLKIKVNIMVLVDEKKAIIDNIQLFYSNI